MNKYYYQIRPRATLINDETITANNSHETTCPDLKLVQILYNDFIHYSYNVSKQILSLYAVSVLHINTVHKPVSQLIKLAGNRSTTLLSCINLNPSDSQVSFFTAISAVVNP